MAAEVHCLKTAAERFKETRTRQSRLARWQSWAGPANRIDRIDRILIGLVAALLLTVAAQIYIAVHTNYMIGSFK